MIQLFLQGDFLDIILSIPTLSSFSYSFVFVRLLKSDNQSLWLKLQSFIIYLFSWSFYFPSLSSMLLSYSLHLHLFLSSLG